jgi:mono/diheme cytochrome c family protein
MKMSRYVFAIVAICLLPSLMFAAAGDAVKGKDVYTAKCKSCHGADGTPNAGMAKAMGIKPMSDKDIQAKSDADLKKAVSDGFGKMKPVAGVAGADLDNVIAFVRTLK